MALRELDYADEYVAPVCRMEKPFTARWALDMDPWPGEWVVLTDEDGVKFADAKIGMNAKMKAAFYVERDIPQYCEYESVDDFIKRLNLYYPDVILDAESVITVLGLSEVHPMSDYQWD